MADDVYASRNYFPRGLFQPPGSFRFSADALLLAAFAVRHCLPERGAALLDLGCGCGVVGLACLLARPELAVTGVDVQPQLVAAARENAVRLGLETRYGALEADLSTDADASVIAPGGFDVVVANMPYRSAASGRVPRSAARRRALVADETTLPAFLGTAARALTPGGSLGLIYPWSGRETLLRALESFAFPVREILPVRTGTETGARCLIRAEQTDSSSGADSVLHAPLLLRAEPGGPYTEEALSFCPWLQPRPRHCGDCE